MTTFGVNGHLVHEGLLESVNLARHTAGNTHKDTGSLSLRPFAVLLALSLLEVQRGPHARYS